MATSVGDIEATLLLRDEMTAELRKATVAAIGSAEDIKAAFRSAGDGFEDFQKTLRDFSGVDLLKNATLTAGAVEQLGGVTRLTAEEQKRANQVVTEALAKYKALGIEAPLAVRRLAEDTQKLVQPTSFLNKAMGDLGAQVKAVALGFISAQAIIGTVQAGFRMLRDFVAGSVEAFAEQEAAVKKLTVALQNQGTATPAVISGMKDLATEFQNTTVYADELINEMQGLLIQVGDVAPGQMRQALTAATDLASGLGVDLRTATMLVGKAFAGETATLKRYGLVIDETRLATEGATAVLDEIQKRFGGQAQAELDTYAGKVKQLANQWGEFKEAVGGAIAQDALLNAALAGLTGALKSEAEATEEVSAKTRELSALYQTSTDRARAFVGGGIGMVVQALYEWAEAANVARIQQEMLNNLKPPRGFGDVEMPKPLGGQPDFNLLRTEFEALVKAVKPLNAEQREMVDLLNKAGKDAKEYATRIGATAKAIDNYEKQTKEATKATDEHRREIKKLAEEDLKRLIESYNTFADNVKRIRSTIVDGVPDGLAEIGRFPIDQIKRSWDQWGESLKKIHSVTTGIGNELKDLGKADAGINELASDSEDWLKILKAARQEIDRMFQGAVRQGANLVGNLFGNPQAFNSIIGSVQQAAKATKLLQTEGLSTADQAKASASVVVAQMTTFIALQQMVAQWSKQAHHNAGEAALTFMRASGTLRDFNLQARLAGVNLEELFHIKDQEAFNALFEKAKADIEANQRLMERFGLTWKDFSALTADFVRYTAGDLIDAFNRLTGQGVDVGKILKGMSGDLNRLIIDAVQTGRKVPAAMRPILEQLVRTKQLSEEAARALLGLAESGGPAFEDVMEAAQRYGIELDALGPKIRQLQVTDLALQIVKDFNLLVDAGGDVNGILEGMKDEVQEVVTSALKLGLTLPESMRPIIEAMIRAGLLTDQFGTKLTDTSQLQFAKPLTDKIDELIEAIKELIDETDRYGQRAVSNFDRARGAAEALGKAIPRGFASNPPGAGTAQPRDTDAPPDPSTPGAPAPPPNGETPAAGATYLNIERVYGTVDESFVENFFGTVAIGGRLQSRARAALRVTD